MPWCPDTRISWFRPGQPLGKHQLLNMFSLNVLCPFLSRHRSVMQQNFSVFGEFRKISQSVDASLRKNLRFVNSPQMTEISPLHQRKSMVDDLYMKMHPWLDIDVHGGSMFWYSPCGSKDVRQCYSVTSGISIREGTAKVGHTSTHSLFPWKSNSNSKFRFLRPKQSHRSEGSSVYFFKKKGAAEQNVSQPLSVVQCFVHAVRPDCSGFFVTNLMSLSEGPLDLAFVICPNKETWYAVLIVGKTQRMLRPITWC